MDTVGVRQQKSRETEIANIQIFRPIKLLDESEPRQGEQRFLAEAFGFGSNCTKDHCATVSMRQQQGQQQGKSDFLAAISPANLRVCTADIQSGTYKCGPFSRSTGRTGSGKLARVGRTRSVSGGSYNYRPGYFRPFPALNAAESSAFSTIASSTTGANLVQSLNGLGDIFEAGGFQGAALDFRNYAAQVQNAFANLGVFSTQAQAQPFVDQIRNAINGAEHQLQNLYNMGNLTPDQLEMFQEQLQSFYENSNELINNAYEAQQEEQNNNHNNQQQCGGGGGKNNNQNQALQQALAALLAALMAMLNNKGNDNNQNGSGGNGNTEPSPTPTSRPAPQATSTPTPEPTAVETPSPTDTPVEFPSETATPTPEATSTLTPTERKEKMGNRSTYMPSASPHAAPASGQRSRGLFHRPQANGNDKDSFHF